MSDDEEELFLDDMASLIVILSRFAKQFPERKDMFASMADGIALAVGFHLMDEDAEVRDLMDTARAGTDILMAHSGWSWKDGSIPGVDNG